MDEKTKNRLMIAGGVTATAAAAGTLYWFFTQTSAGKSIINTGNKYVISLTDSQGLTSDTVTLTNGTATDSYVATVLDSNNNPVPNITVYLYENSNLSTPVDTKTTDSSGVADFTESFTATGTYTLVAGVDE